MVPPSVPPGPWGADGTFATGETALLAGDDGGRGPGSGGGGCGWFCLGRRRAAVVVVRPSSPQPGPARARPPRSWQ